MQPEPPAKPPPEVEPAPVVAAHVEEPSPVQTASLNGVIMDEFGAPLAGARVELSSGETALEVFTDDKGVYTFSDVPFGQITVAVTADGYVPVDWQVLFDADAAGQQVPVNLKKAAPLGQLRGLVRSWNSEPIAATVDIRNEKGKPVTTAQADAEGRFQVDLKEGAYRVKVSAPGFKPQTSKVRLRERGVTILNLDLRSK